MRCFCKTVFRWDDEKHRRHEVIGDRQEALGKRQEPGDVGTAERSETGRFCDQKDQETNSGQLAVCSSHLKIET